MTGKHYAVFGSLLIGLALEIGGLHGWREALQPQFVAGALTTIGAVIGGTLVQPPAPK